MVIMVGGGGGKYLILKIRHLKCKFSPPPARFNEFLYYIFKYTYHFVVKQTILLKAKKNSLQAKLFFYYNYYIITFLV